MRGQQDPQVTMLAFVDLEARVPPDHPLRIIKALADQALAALSCELCWSQSLTPDEPEDEDGSSLFTPTLRLVGRFKGRAGVNEFLDLGDPLTLQIEYVPVGVSLDVRRFLACQFSGVVTTSPLYSPRDLTQTSS